MHHLIIYSHNEIRARVRNRKHETKIGETIHAITSAALWEEELYTTEAKYVLLGLPEDIGVRANYGRPGAHAAWKPALDFLLNMQSNQFLSGNELLVLGHIDFSDIMLQANAYDTKSEADISKLRELVEQIDARVEHVVLSIVAAGKIPIIIGGGHNNAYPIIKAVSKIKKIPQGIHVINCDPHTDFRPMEGRHSGNGFRYAYEENYLHKYAVFGMHECYNTAHVIHTFQQNADTLFFETYDSIFIHNTTTFDKALHACIQFCSGAATGIEIDLDAIQNIPASARTPSGMLPIDVRRFVWQAATQLSAAYLHIAEGAPVLAHKQVDNKTGKLIAYLITDFIKAAEKFF